MKKGKKKNGFDNKVAKYLGWMFILSIVYLGISVGMLIPAGIKLLNNYYIIESNDLPNFSDVFNSIFTTLNIIITTVVSYMIYRLNKSQDIDRYNKEIAGPSLLLLYSIKYNIMRSISIFLINNIDELEESYYTRKVDNKKVNSKQYIKTTTFPKFPQEELKENIPSIIGHVTDEKIKTKLYMLFLDINKRYKSSNKDIGDILIYTLKEDLIKEGHLIEKDSKKWVYIISGMQNNDWSCLKDDYREIMNQLSNISKSRK
ncbi:hypothetical protein [Romboutsia sp. 1001713B170131_170501_G6]|uniref:hypothetical protein n=1 Tax=Romboutsia sp. 1001713B170131_170501_G6 TaxID=2787108 RepID=UPI0018AA96EA|nr:hypothetical protein [Romboutsia sp. 1001713B170131_170501_G6]